MSEVWSYCRCGNPTVVGYPVCGLAICLATDAYNRGMMLAKESNDKKNRALNERRDRRAKA